MTNNSDQMAQVQATDAEISVPNARSDFFDRHEGHLDGYLSQEASIAMRARQQSRARVMGVLLGAAAILFFAITVVRLGAL